ncbi:FtsX-like permease family protein [Nonomuraea sp. SBT364]|uniref:FtsX-like permease family protein n=1 Tax=Nonomuraea sp. SBT364 TaxID=1580530 RepID=UPI00066C2CF9|nr:FtsX-like permease family protein [Nonomuraea sp. SBT364]
MLRMSWAGFLERWTLFVGAALAVCLGVALVQSSLLLLISAATLDPPAGLGAGDRMRFAMHAEASIAVIALVLAFSVLLAVFVISSTFAFTVAQRRRDLALLRLVGGSPGHVRRLLLGEAVLLGAIGVITGVPAGLAVMEFQSWLLVTLGFVPPGFAGEWRGWILAVSAGAGLGLAVAGVLVAARRAARVRPLEALRETGEATRVMTAGRWALALLFVAGAVTLTILSPIGGPVGGQAMASTAAIPAVLALTVLAPVLVPAAALLLPIRPGSVLGELARANLRDSVRRSASTAGPLIVLVGLVLAQAGAGTSFTAAAQAEQREHTAADLVVEATGPLRVADVPGVAAASTEVEVPVTITTGSGEDQDTSVEPALVVDPAAYTLAHPGSGSLTALRGRAAAAGPGADEVSAGDRIEVRFTEGAFRVPVVAAVPTTIAGGAELLLPRDLVADALLADAPSHTFVSLRPGADPSAVRAALGQVGTVWEVDTWLARDGAARQATSNAVFVVIMGLGAVYALIGVVNSGVIAAAARRREFAEARATGLTRGQVVRLALTESFGVTAVALLLGGLAAGASFAGVLGTTSAVTGSGTLALPWGLVAAVVVVAFLATGATSVITSWSATRGRPVTLLAARE